MQENEILDFEPQKEGGFIYASFWTRVLASLIDTLIFIPILVLNFVNLFNWKIYLLDVFLGLLYVIYKPLMEWKYGATWGKMAVKIKVVTLDGQLMTFQQSLTRFTFYFASYFIGMITSYNTFHAAGFENLTRLLDLGAFQSANATIFNTLSTLMSVLILVSVLFVAFDSQRRQALHDKLASTFVIKA